MQRVGYSTNSQLKKLNLYGGIKMVKEICFQCGYELCEACKEKEKHNQIYGKLNNIEIMSLFKERCQSVTL